MKHYSKIIFIFLSFYFCYFLFFLCFTFSPSSFAGDFIGGGGGSVGADSVTSSSIVDDTIVADDIDETGTFSFEDLAGKQTRNTTSVNDDDCTGEQGLWWYDDTDSAFEFCNNNSGVPDELGSSGGFLLFGGDQGNVSTDFYFSFGQNHAAGGVEEAQQGIVPAITCTKICAQVDVAPGAGQSWTFYLRDDGVNTALSVVISDTEVSDCGTGTVSIAAESLVNIFMDEASTSTGTSGQSFAVTCNLT